MMTGHHRNAEAALSAMRHWSWHEFDPDILSDREVPTALPEVVNRLAMEGVPQPHFAVLQLLTEGRLTATANYHWQKWEAGQRYHLEGSFAHIPPSRWQQLSSALADEWERLKNSDPYKPVLEKLGLGECAACEWDALSGRFSIALRPPETPAWQVDYFEERFSAWDIEICLPKAEQGDEMKIESYSEPSALVAIPADAPKGKSGAPRKWDWDGALLHLAALAHHAPDGLLRRDGGDPNQSDIADHLRGWFIDQTGNAPSDSQLRAYGAKFVAELNALKLKGANNL